MGYRATGSGYAKLNKGVNDLFIEQLLDESPFECSVYTGTDNCDYIDILHCDNYYTDTVYEWLERLAPYISDLSIDFDGEDGDRWQIFLNGNGKIEEEAIDCITHSEHKRLRRYKEALKRVLYTCADSLFGTNGAGVSVLRYVRSLGLEDADLRALELDWLFDLEEDTQDEDTEPCAQCSDEDITWLLSSSES